MKKLLVIMTVLVMCATSALCAEVTPKKKGPSAKAKAYERASDKASFKRTVESKEKKTKKDVEAQKKTAKEETKGKKKRFLWW